MVSNLKVDWAKISDKLAKLSEYIDSIYTYALSENSGSSQNAVYLSVKSSSGVTWTGQTTYTSPSQKKSYGGTVGFVPSFHGATQAESFRTETMTESMEQLLDAASKFLADENKPKVKDKTAFNKAFKCMDEYDPSREKVVWELTGVANMTMELIKRTDGSLQVRHKLGKDTDYKTKEFDSISPARRHIKAVLEDNGVKSPE